MNALKRRWKLVSLAVLAVLVAALLATTATARSGASPIRIAVLSDCQGAFGSFDNQDMAGVVTAMVQYAGAKAKNPNKPRDGWVGGQINGHPLKLVGVGCSNDRADTAIKETKRLMEQLKADIMIGPLSGDESIAVANYAKQHPTKTFVDGAAGAQDTTLKVRAPNFFRFNGDGAQWNAGLGDLAYNKLGWKTAAVVADDYSFAWTSTAGFVAEFCAVGGKVTKRVFPPLNTTDYSSYAQQMPTNVDGTFVAVGGAGLIPFLKAYEQAHGPIDGKKFIGNLFWGTPGQFEQLSSRVAGAYVGGAGTAGDLATPAAQAYNKLVGRIFKTDPAVRGGCSAGVVHVHVRLLREHLGPAGRSEGREGRPLGWPEEAAEGGREGSAPHAVRADPPGQEPPGDHPGLLPAAVHEGRQAGRQDHRLHPGCRPELRRHVLAEDARTGAELSAVRQAEPALGRSHTQAGVTG